MRKDATQGSLSVRVKKVKKKHQALTKLLTESAEIEKQGNIISFEKQAANKDNEASELSKEQKDSLMSELLTQKMLLDDSCGMVNHTQDGIDYLQNMTESAKKLLMDINTRLPHC